MFSKTNPPVLEPVQSQIRDLKRSSSVFDGHEVLPFLEERGKLTGSPVVIVPKFRLLYHGMSIPLAENAWAKSTRRTLSTPIRCLQTLVSNPLGFSSYNDKFETKPESERVFAQVEARFEKNLVAFELIIAAGGLPPLAEDEFDIDLSTVMAILAAHAGWAQDNRLLLRAGGTIYRSSSGTPTLLLAGYEGPGRSIQKDKVGPNIFDVRGKVIR